MVTKKIMLPLIAAVTVIGAGLFGTNYIYAQSNRQHNMQQRLDQRLSQAVTDKKITEAQKQAILTELQQLQTKQNRRTELQAWAKQQGIDLYILMPHAGFHKGRWLQQPQSSPKT